MEELFFVWSFVSYYLYEIVTIFISSLAVKNLWKRIFHGYNLPPGPWGLPFVGYFPFVGDLPHFTFNELAKKYGPVFSLKIGFRYCVVLNDFESVKEAYQKEAFSGRTPGTFKLTSKSENFSEQSGDMWRDHKKLFLSFTRTISKLEDESGRSPLEQSIMNEVERFVSNIENSVHSVVNVRDNLVDFMYKVVFKYLMGRDITEDNSLITESLSAQHTPLLYTGTVKALGQSFPQLRAITKWWEPFGDAYVKATRDTEMILRKVVDEHKRKLGEEPKDYIDFFLIQQMENPRSPLYTDDVLLGNLQSFILGGSHTVRGSLEWLFVLLAAYQNIQQKMYQEIQEEIPSDGIPTWELKHRLTYSYAIILESMRLFTLAPVNTPRWVMEDTMIKGFDIPKGTVVYSNNWAINHDPSYWKNPMEFLPERFIDEDEPKKIRSLERLVSFSYGRRECPGKQQAMMEVFLLFTRTIQKFRILPVEGNESLATIQKTMISIPNNPYIVFRKRP